MTAELQLLVWAVILTLAQLAVTIAGSLATRSMPELVGNREGFAESPGWVGRAGRAHRNMLESLIPFAALVLVAHAAGASNAMTLLGAQIFVAARVAFAVIYIAGVPWLRTGAWILATSGLVLMLVQLV
jgi:uncharacterized MAPEG superfamily protein